ncbi:MAG: flavin reductase family protein [Clostridia bacterium]|nr:flavin reductase family protein [Eubacteriales bacterium]MDO4353009.1 flavin reductase family protein [Clostridia bacterium]MDY2932744.1 flavin reductase family protein [Anaerovoracaceae bacterium]
MGKRSFKGGAMLNPVPAVMVSCGSRKPNIITIAWTGIVNSNPPMTYISVRKERYSHNIIENTGEFVINLCSEELAFATDFCGVRSGRDTDKFKEMKLTPERAEIVRCPMIKESPVNIECRVREIIELGSHDMFIADILKVHVDEQYIDRSGRIRLDQASLVAYNHGEYFGLKRQPIGKFGFSVMKPKTRKRINREKQGGNRRTGIKKTK